MDGPFPGSVHSRDAACLRHSMPPSRDNFPSRPATLRPSHEHSRNADGCAGTQHPRPVHSCSMPHHHVHQSPQQVYGHMSPCCPREQRHPVTAPPAAITLPHAETPISTQFPCPPAHGHSKAETPMLHVGPALHRSLRSCQSPGGRWGPGTSAACHPVQASTYTTPLHTHTHHTWCQHSQGHS